LGCATFRFKVPLGLSYPCVESSLIRISWSRFFTVLRKFETTKTASQKLHNILRQHKLVVFSRAYTPAGQGQTDPYACANSKNADAAGLLSEVYMTPQPISTKTGAQQLDEILTMFSNCGVTVVSLWIQVTSPDNWSRTLSTNLNFLNSIFSRAGQYGVSIGIYTSSSEWNSITDYKKRGNYCRYWNVHGGGVPNETPANFNDFRSFGGWTSPSVKQFAQTEGFCGITANRYERSSHLLRLDVFILIFFLLEERVTS
uniref:Glycoside hydrolase n=1 Tax=Heligmosomoides polygyrus TaxID=6339 RepID=A0A183FYR3_HELPZ